MVTRSSPKKSRVYVEGSLEWRTAEAVNSKEQNGASHGFFGKPATTSFTVKPESIQYCTTDLERSVFASAVYYTPEGRKGTLKAVSPNMPT